MNDYRVGKMVQNTVDIQRALLHLQRTGREKEDQANSMSKIPILQRVALAIN
jgi:hypothetical protein